MRQIFILYTYITYLNLLHIFNVKESINLFERSESIVSVV